MNGENENIREQQVDNSEDNTEASEGVKLHIPKGIMIFLFLILAFDVVCMVRFPKVFREYKIYATAEDRIKNGETSLALAELYDLAESRSYSVPILMKNVELAMKYGYYDNAGYLIDTYLAGKEVSDAEYVKLNSYMPRLESYYATYEAVQNEYNKYMPNAKLTEEDYAKLKDRLLLIVDGPNMDQAYIYYNLAFIEADTKLSLSYMQKSYEIDPELFDTRVQLAVMYRRTGDYDTALTMTEAALKKDKKDVGALRSMAILRLLKEDYEGGYSYAKEAYDSNPEGTYVRETYAIALSFNGMVQEAQVILEEMNSLGTPPDELMEQLLDREISLQEYYVEG